MTIINHYYRPRFLSFLNTGQIVKIDSRIYHVFILVQVRMMSSIKGDGKSVALHESNCWATFFGELSERNPSNESSGNLVCWKSQLYQPQLELNNSSLGAEQQSWGVHRWVGARNALSVPNILNTTRLPHEWTAQWIGYGMLWAMYWIGFRLL